MSPIENPFARVATDRMGMRSPGAGMLAAQYDDNRMGMRGPVDRTAPVGGGFGPIRPIAQPSGDSINGISPYTGMFSGPDGQEWYLTNSQQPDGSMMAQRWGAVGEDGNYQGWFRQGPNGLEMIGQEFEKDQSALKDLAPALAIGGAFLGGQMLFGGGFGAGGAAGAGAGGAATAFPVAAPGAAVTAPLGVGGAAAAGGTGMLGSAANFLTGPIGSRLAGAGVDLITGAITDRSARRAQDEMFRNQMTGAADFRAAGERYAQGIRDFRDPTVNNGFATSRIDPTTGQVSYGLNQPYQGLRDRFLGGSNSVLDQLRDFNPQTFASDRFTAMQGLLAPQRQQQQQSLMQDLFNKGGFGLTLNTPTQNGTQGINPYVNSLTSAWAQQDKQMAYDSLNQGEQYMDNLLRRSQGMLGTGMGIEREGQGVLGEAARWGNTFYGRNRDALGAERDAVQDYIRSVLGAQSQRTGTNAAAGAERNSMIRETIRDVPWNDVFRGLRGLFG